MKIGKKEKIFKINRKKKNDLVPVLTMIGLAAVIALPIAAVWQKADTPMEKQTTPQYILDRRAADEEDKNSSDSSYVDTSSEDVSSNSASSSDASSSDSSDTTSEAPEKKGSIVPESEWVEASYFDDAVFVGDSLTVGIDTYEVMTNATVLASEGLSPLTILNNTAVRNKSGTEVKVIDALKELEPKKIYIMLGSNGFFWMDKGDFIYYYEKFIEEVRAQHPDATLYIQSIMPVTKSKEDSDERFKNSIINEYNEAILKMCEEMDLNYVNCAEAVKQEDGTLPEEASPSDGMHFTATYYRKWMDYLRKHTI